MPRGKKNDDSSRLTAHEIYESASLLARDELKRPIVALAFSGFAGGLTMGLTGLSAALVSSLLGTGTVARFIIATVYPIRLLVCGGNPEISPVGSSWLAG